MKKLRRQEDTTFGDTAVMATELALVAALAKAVRDNADNTQRMLAAEGRLFKWLGDYELARIEAGVPPLT